MEGLLIKTTWLNMECIMAENKGLWPVEKHIKGEFDKEKVNNKRKKKLFTAKSHSSAISMNHAYKSIGKSYNVLLSIFDNFPEDVEFQIKTLSDMESKISEFQKAVIELKYFIECEGKI